MVKLTHSPYFKFSLLSSFFLFWFFFLPSLIFQRNKKSYFFLLFDWFEKHLLHIRIHVRICKVERVMDHIRFLFFFFFFILSYFFSYTLNSVAIKWIASNHKRDSTNSCDLVGLKILRRQTSTHTHRSSMKKNNNKMNHPVKQEM